MEKITLRKYTEDDMAAMLPIWNEVVEEGEAFPQEEQLTLQSGKEFFAAQSYCGVAEAGGKIVGLYILHPNNIGRCGHICNASYAVASSVRGQGVGRKLVEDCLAVAPGLGFCIIQFNAVVASNAAAHKLYPSLGFKALGAIPGGFRRKDGSYEEIRLYYREL